MNSRIAASFALAAGLARAGTAGLRAVAPGGRGRWERTNHAGRSVGLYAGPAVAAAAATAGPAVAAAAAAATGRVRPAAGPAVLAAGACGAYDDVAGVGDPRRGFRAHLGALRGGEVTSGAVKLLGISAAGLVARARRKERPLDKLLAGVVNAGAAHAVNLLDVRPGRAAGAVLALAAPGLLRGGPGAELAAAATGAAAAVLPEDLGERVMLGDTGAHALGAALGVAAVACNGHAGLIAHSPKLFEQGGPPVAVTVAAVYGEKMSGRKGAPSPQCHSSE
ncbi:hypothetical protein C1I97_31820 [Streptomyces sp. NTH33]|uniref:hypothetical protein n=1 Tax=Streptomyces sp. NTH33 TaxID=1735453 RepID=UPI000DA788DF|nr:hypothetical protein [Streptomyces sp. NTH33]PZG88616.1 hypothetical protein C1I97_31820 [Streptomyces sp. NTH33]